MWSVSGQAETRVTDKDLGFPCFFHRIRKVAPETGSLKTVSTANLPEPEADT